MKTHFLRSFLRGIVKRPLIYSINFVGLILSMSVVIILAVCCLGEIKANRFNENINNIYMICSEGFDKKLGTYTPAILKEHIEEKIPEVEKIVRIRDPWTETTLQVGQNPSVTSSLIFADPDFADVFSYQNISGNLKEALKTPMSIVLTKNESLKLFGNTSPIGETVKVDNEHILTVKAIIDEPRGKSSLQFKAVVPMISIGTVSPNGDELTTWRMSNFTSFVLLNRASVPDNIGKKIARLYPENNFSPKISLQPFSSFYFSDIDISRRNFLKTGNKSTTTILGFVAVIILLMGIVNYLNLSFSMTIERLKSTGILKVIGAKRGHIIRNIIKESALFFFVSIVIAYITAWFLIPFLVNKTGVEIHPGIIFNPVFLLLSVLLTLVIAVVSVIVPAIRLSSIKPVDSLKKSLSGTGGNNHTRRVLVIAQFTVAIALISFTWAIQKQVKYGFTQLGYNKENIYTIQLTPQLKKDVLKEQLVKVAGIKDISYTTYLPGKATIGRCFGMTIMYKGQKKENISAHIIRCDSNFPGLLGLKIIKGRSFSPDLVTDKDKVIINKAFADEYGLDEPLGVKVPASRSDDMEIIGLVENFHFQSVHQPISPVIIRYNDYARYCYVKIASSDFNSLHRTVKGINEVTMALSSGFPVNSEFLDTSVAKMYKAEVQFRKIFFLFSGVAILICCLGILGLSVFASERRVKEIGIRKVNGARVSEILTMLNRDFVKWVVIAFVIATPIAWYAMHKWLENFAYKTGLSWWIFVLAGVLALGIALLTVSWQSWKAAVKNPVESLRYE